MASWVHPGPPVLKTSMWTDSRLVGLDLPAVEPLFASISIAFFSQFLLHSIPDRDGPRELHTDPLLLGFTFLALFREDSSLKPGALPPALEALPGPGLALGGWCRL